MRRIDIEQQIVGQGESASVLPALGAEPKHGIGDSRVVIDEESLGPDGAIRQFETVDGIALDCGASRFQHTPGQRAVGAGLSPIAASRSRNAISKRPLSAAPSPISTRR